MYACMCVCAREHTHREREARNGEAHGNRDGTNPKPTLNQPAPGPRNHNAAIHVKLLLLARCTSFAAAPPISLTRLLCPGRRALHKRI